MCLNDGKIAEMLWSSDKQEESGDNDDHHIMNTGEKLPPSYTEKNMLSVKCWPWTMCSGSVLEVTQFRGCCLDRNLSSRGRRLE